MMEKSLWQARSELPEFPMLSEDINTDVLVIGGGLAGILTAYRLRQQGIEAVIVEKDRICSGTTAHTTAKITALHGLIYHKIARLFNDEYAKMYYQANTEAVESLRSLCQKAGCEIENKDSFVYSMDESKVEKELVALQRLGIGAKYVRSVPLPVPVAGAVGFEGQGQFDPLKLAGYLSKDLKIYEHTKVKEMVGTTAVTDHGTIKAKKVVVATHFPFLNKHGSYFLKLYQHRSYLLAVKDAPTVKAMYVDDSKTGLSFSSFDGYLLLGGGGHRTGKQGGCYQELREVLRHYAPNAKEVLHWAAQDTMSLDGIPYIGNYFAQTPDLYVAAGFNKWGMTGSVVSAEIISGIITGKRKEYAPVFSPSRSILRPQLVVNGFETTKNLLTPTAPRCPHLGCALKYNKEERSWDCACHGSRFAEDGKLLNNPANDDLSERRG